MQGVTVFTRYSFGSFNVSEGILAVSLIDFRVVLLSILERHSVLGNVPVVMIDCTVFHDTFDVREVHLYPSPDQYISNIRILYMLCGLGFIQ